MSEFKKAFRGYSTDEVDKKIEELNARITESENKKKMLENTVDELKSKEQNLNQKISELENQIQDFNNDRIQMEKKLSGNSIPTETVGKIYVKAYESGEQLALSPMSHIDRLVHDVKSVSARTRSDFNTAQNDFASFSVKIQKMINEIISNNKTMLESVQNLNSELSSVGAAYSEFDSIEEKVYSDMERILDEYKSNVGDLAEKGITHNISEKTHVKKTEPEANKIYADSKQSVDKAVTEPTVISDKAIAEPAVINDESVIEPAAINDEADTKSVVTEIEENEPVKPEVKKETQPVVQAQVEEEIINEPDTETDISNIAESEYEESLVDEDSEIAEDSVADFASERTPSPTETRGNNIMNLLNKYQKKTS